MGDDVVTRMIEAERSHREGRPRARHQLPAHQARPRARWRHRHRRGRLARDPGVHRGPPRPGRAHAGADRPRRRALPVLPGVRAAQAPRRQDPQRPRGPAVPRRAQGRVRPVVHGPSSTPTATTVRASTRRGQPDEAPRPVSVRRDARHPAGRLLPRAVPGQARGRGQRVHHHRRLPRRSPAPPARAERHPRAVRAAAHRHQRRARQAGRPRAARVVDLRLLRLR